MLWRRWLKWFVAVDTDRQVLLAQAGLLRPLQRLSAMLCLFVDAAHEVTPLGLILVDAEFEIVSKTTTSCASSSRQRT
jgi:hypothetical protein